MLVCPVCEAIYPDGSSARCPNDDALLYVVGDLQEASMALGPDAVVAGKFRIMSEITRRGGAGRTFKAEQLNLQRIVELRMLPPNSISKPGDHERFRREVATWGRIQDDHLVRLYDSGYADGTTPYMVLEYFNGGVVGEILQQYGAFPIDWLLMVAKHILKALTSAHGAHVLHRDISPDAIIVSQDASGKPHFRLTGFGLAKHLNDDDDPTAITMTGQVLGQPAYMAPETIMQGVLDQRTDLYALGITLFELATARRPFLSTSLAEMLGEHIQGNVPPVGNLRTDLPGFFQVFIHRLIARDPAARYVSAIEALNALLAVERQQDPSIEPVEVEQDELTLNSPTPWLIGAFCVFSGLLGWLFFF